MSRLSTSVLYSSTRSVLGDNAESAHEYKSHERSQSLRSGPHGLTAVTTDISKIHVPSISHEWLCGCKQ